MTTRRHLRLDNAQRVRRMDRMQVDASLRPATRTAAGYLVVDAAVAVPGVMEYVDADGGIVREYIPPDELHDPESLETLGAVPVTLLHPDERVTPDNVSELGVGSSGTRVQILKESGHIAVELVIQRRDALDAIAAGIDEVSPVYTCTLDETPGTTPEGERYDRIQRDRRYSEVAVVPEARGGPTVKLRTDCDDRVAVRRLDAAPAQAVFRTVHLDSGSRPVPTPSPPGRPTMHKTFLLLLASTLGADLCPYVGRADGTIRNTRTDMEISEEQLQAAIMAAIAKLQEMMAAAEEGGGEGGSMEEMQAQVDALKQEKADLEHQLAEMQAGMAQEKENADRARLDGIADDLGIDRTSWPKDISSDERRLKILQAKNLLSRDDKVRSDANPNGASRERMDGQIDTLVRLSPSTGGRTRTRGTSLHLDGRPPAQEDGNNQEPTERTDARRSDGLKTNPGDPARQQLIDAHNARRTG